MKSLEAQFVEIKTALLDGKKCVEADLTPFTAFPTMEQRLSELKKYAAGKGITESKKIVRNNGRGSVEITESDKKTERVQQYMKKARCSFREASIALFGTDPGKDAKLPDTVIAERAAKWRKYAPTISEQEAMTLALKGIEP
jgi:hypothetical protein